MVCFIVFLIVFLVIVEELSIFWFDRAGDRVFYSYHGLFAGFCGEFIVYKHFFKIWFYWV